MIFSAKIVTTNKKGIALLTMCLVGFLLLAISMIVECFQAYSIYLFSIILAVVVVGVLYYKGDIAVYSLEEELFVFSDCFEMSKLVFPFNQLSDIIIHFESFKGMRQYSYDADLDADVRKNGSTYGMANLISFKYKSQSFKYRFFVQDKQHFIQFVSMLESLYFRHIQFEENNWYGKTFLMQNVSASEYKILKSKY